MGSKVNCFEQLKAHGVKLESHTIERMELVLRFALTCKELKICRGKVDSEIEKELPVLLDRLDTFIGEWRDKLLDLKHFFRREDIDWLLKQTVINAVTHSRCYRGQRVIDFVVRSGYKDEPELDENGKPSSRRPTALHIFAGLQYSSIFTPMVRGLFQIYDRFDVNCADERGYTHFQTACMYGFAGAVKKFLELGQDPDCLVTRTGDSPLHLALYHEHKSVTELLLRAGADPNSVDLFGSSPLHNICEIGYDNHELLDTFFAICDEKGQTLRVDARDESGRTPLHFAVQNGCREMFELLLRRGANPNLADAEGLTPLHIISMRSRDDDLTEMFFELNDELNQRVRVDVWNKKGWTPLQSALRRGNKKTAEILLRRGADANLANEDGLTPLHVICQTYVYDDLAKIFFDICDELNQVIQVDAKDKSGCTPLDLAVVNLMPNTIDVLLDHGADLSGFVFSSSSHFDKSFVVESTDWLPRGKLRLAFGLMLVVERLENRGYKLDRGDVLTIMKTFAKNELFEMSAGVVKNWYDDKETKRQAKEAMVNSSLSLYDLIQLRPEEATKLPTYEDCLKLANTINWWDFPESHWKVCGKHLVEKICRGFFRRWSMDPFMKLTNDSLPHLPCEMIMKNLENEDLYHICAAAAGEIRDVHKRISRISYV